MIDTYVQFLTTFAKIFFLSVGIFASVFAILGLIFVSLVAFYDEVLKDEIKRFKKKV